jgi:rare lipoprotein A (peptidoglycan hydrolase)
MNDQNFQARYASSILVTRSKESPASSGVCGECEAAGSVGWSAPAAKRLHADPLRRSYAWLAVVVIALLVLGAFVERAEAASASCYGPGLFGNSTASGSILTRSTLGVAHKSLPFGTRLHVRVNGRTTTLRVIDRGPFVAGRHLDLTEASVRRLGFASCRAWGHRKVRSWRAR